MQPRQTNALPIWRDAQRLLLAVERAVSTFPRRHRFGLGEDLRRLAQRICRRVNRAWRAPAMRQVELERLVWDVDDLKTLLQLGKELRVFSSFREFQDLAELAVQLGKQSGGWRRRLGTQPEVRPS